MTPTSAHTATSAAPAALRFAPPFWPVVIAAAAVYGVAAAFRPGLAVAAMFALVLVPVLLTRPIVGLSIVLLLSFLETYSGITGTVSLTKIVGALLVLSWLVIVATLPPGERASVSLVRQQPALSAALIVLAALASMSLAWADQPAVARSAVVRLVLNLALFPIALVAMRRQRDVAWLFGVFIVGALVTVVLGFLQGPATTGGEAGRLEAAGLNPNQLGSYAMVAIIFAAAFFASRKWPAMARGAALVAAALAAAGLFLSLSRGALLGLAVALLVAPLTVGRGRRAAALALVVLTAAGATTWFAAIASPAAVDRITHPQRAGGSGREDLWRVGWRMVDAHPIQGVGAGNFGVSAVHYLLRPGATQRDQYIVRQNAIAGQAHNVYLTVLAELGIFGLALFVVILVICLSCALLAARTFAARGDPATELLARALFLALVGLLVADFFSSQIYSKQLWFLLAAAPALLAVARRSGSGDGAVASDRLAIVGPRR